MVICLDCNHNFDARYIPGFNENQICPKCGSSNLNMHTTVYVKTAGIKVSGHNATIQAVNPFSFGTIITLHEKVEDGQIIKLIEPAYQELRIEIKKNPDIIYKIKWRQWEEIIAAAYKNRGFDEVVLTPGSGDLGRDVIAVKHGICSLRFIDQVKAYSPDHKVKADEVRSLLGVLSSDHAATKAVLTTTSYFAPGVMEDPFIKPYIPYRLELVDKDRLLQILD